MGGLVSGLFDLFAGNPYEAQTNQLNQIAGYQTNLGEGLATPAAKYFEDILSGDPTRIASALAPEISTGQGQVEQQRLRNAEFGTRSGGSTAATNAAENAERGNIINLEGGLQSGAASTALGQGSNLVAQGVGTTGEVAGLKNQRRQQVMGDVGNIASGVASIAMPFLGGGSAPTGDPYAILYGAQHPDRTSIQPQSVDALSNFQF